jgi:hypothetical protein
MEGKQRPRGYSGHMSDEFTSDDLHIMKIMEEIIELDQEVKLKQEFINNRMSMLNRLLPKQDGNDEKKKTIENFLMKFDHHCQNHKRLKEGYEPIPMGMDSGAPIPMPMDSGEPIAMQDKEHTQ